MDRAAPIRAAGTDLTGNHMNFFDGILAAQPFLNNQQSLQQGSVDLGYSFAGVGDEFEYRGRFADGGFNNVLQSNNPYVSQRGLGAIFSNQAAQNNLNAQRQALQLSQAIAQQLGLGGQQQQRGPATIPGIANNPFTGQGPLSIFQNPVVAAAQPRNQPSTAADYDSFLDSTLYANSGPGSYVQLT